MKYLQKRKSINYLGKNDEVIFDKNTFVLYQSGKLNLTNEIKYYLPIIEFSELFFQAGKKDISFYKINELLTDTKPLQISKKTTLIYSDIRKFFSKKEKSRNNIYRDNLYYLASLAIEYGFPLNTTKENYHALKSYHHDDFRLELVKL